MKKLSPKEHFVVYTTQGSHFVLIKFRSTIKFRRFAKCDAFTRLNFWGCDRFEIFGFGMSVKICTDRLAFSKFPLLLFDE